MASQSESSQLSSIEMDAAIEQFCSVTGSNNATARMALEACNWNIELAINMYVDSNDITDDRQPMPPNVDVVSQQNTNHSTNNVLNNLSARQTNSGDDDIRPPIPPVRQVLVEDYPSVSYSNHLRRQNPHSVFDAFRDFEAEARWHEQMVREPGNAVTASKRRTLEDLFRPPLDLICRGTLEYAKDEGQKMNKWLMVNIQNHQEFSCQVLNRDVWSNPAIKSIIKEHFVFWQTYHDTADGQRFMQFYNVVEFPYVAILDPRTGEKLRFWTAIDPVIFCDLVTEFLHDHPSPSGSGNADNFHLLKNQTSEKSLYDESEEMQLKAAIAASLQDSGKYEQNPINQSINDVDDSDLETFDSDNDESNDLSSSAQHLKPKSSYKIESTITTKDNVSSTSTTSSTSTSNSTLINSQPEKELKSIDDWRKYLGPENGKKIEVMVRFPNGNKENISFPSDSQLKALFLYLSEKGYSMNEYDLITNFPKRNLKETACSDEITLELAGIHSRDTLYVQHKT